MKLYEISEIRNLGIIGHGSCGKTSLTSALLFSSGTVNRLGRVAQGNTVTDVPADIVGAVKDARDGLMEMVAEVDDALMEKFFERGSLSQEELAAGLAKGVRQRKIFPVLCASALANVGAHPLLDACVT